MRRRVAICNFNLADYSRWDGQEGVGLQGETPPAFRTQCNRPLERSVEDGEQPLGESGMGDDSTLGAKLSRGIWNTIQRLAVTRFIFNQILFCQP